MTAGSKCDDGNACTAGDVCVESGACVPGPGLSCDDGNGCTTDACDPASGCTHKALDGIGCDDGDACTQADKCTQGTCKGSGKSCDDGLACTSDGCDSAGGCTHVVQKDATCSDNDACTSGDACLDSGYCKPGSKVDCGDDNDCTLDFCGAATGCGHETLTGAACDDDDACTELDVCNDKAKCLGSATNCDDGQACTTDSCDKQVGCKHVAKTDQACDDGNACTTGDVCSALGNCTPGKPLSCDDGKPCTSDACDVGTGCVHADLSGTECTDGDLCTINDICVQGACKGTTKNCDDDNVCTSESCKPLEGCVYTDLKGTPCDDGNVCTKGDTCSYNFLGNNILCRPGKTIDCNDNNPCTSDDCNGATGCSNTALTGKECSDGDLCTINDACSQGNCKGSVRDCYDGNVCTKDDCGTDKGCLNTPTAGVACNDGNACTNGDACTDKGECAGKDVVCNDDNDCTLDTCSTQSGCIFTKLEGAACDDGTACTIKDVCSGGSCAGTSISCDDGEVCTVDSCDKTKGCINTPQNGTACTDGSECTSADACKSGVCTGVTVVCDDGNACTIDACDKASGCVSKNTAKNSNCADSDTCDLEYCDGNGTCVSQPALWVQYIPDAYTGRAILPLDDGSVLVGGASDSSATGGFIQHMQHGKAPTDIRTISKIRSVNAMAVIDKNRVALATDSVDQFAPNAIDGIARVGIYYISTGGTLLVGAEDVQIDKDTAVKPHRWEQISSNDTTVAVSGVRWGRSNHNGILMARHAAKDLAHIDNKLWVPDGVDAYSQITLGGTHLTSKGEVMLLVGLTTKAGSHAYLLEWRLNGTIGATRVWSQPGTESVDFNVIRSMRLVPFADGSFDLLLGGGRIQRRKAGGALDHMITTAETDAVAGVTTRGSMPILVDNSQLVTIRLMNEHWTAVHSAVEINTVPAQIATSTKDRALYTLTPIAAGVSGTTWRVERRDPWGNATCTGCYTTEAEKGCSGGQACRLDRCSTSTGKCLATFNSNLCDDGNACTKNACSDDKASCVTTVKTSKPCDGTLSQCDLSPGICESDGTCTSTTTTPSCDDNDPCTLDVCADAFGCTHTVLLDGTSCGGDKTCLSGKCVDKSGGLKTLSDTTNFKVGPSKTVPLITLPPLTGKKLTALTISIGFNYTLTTHLADFEIAFEIDGAKTVLYDGQPNCQFFSHANCLDWSGDTKNLVWPSVNAPGEWPTTSFKFPITSSKPPAVLLKNRTDSAVTIKSVSVSWAND